MKDTMDHTEVRELLEDAAIDFPADRAKIDIG